MPTSIERQIRVFISSTFRDMGAERDYLVKFIFPELRKLCESRDVTWGEVDLRWGVTDEEAAEGKALPICLEEIKRCRPYFIGMLGERYGWVPQSVPEDLMEREPWLNEHYGQKSVTELEIIHGVLREETMHGHAYFYFRDPRYVESVPAGQREDFIAGDLESAEKMLRLKQAIRNARDEQICQLSENYSGPEVLGEWIREDFTRLIDELFPEGSQPEPLDREALDHEAYARSRANVYIGRQEYFDQLDAHAAAGDTQPLVILGESGSGKSALLANWVAHHRQAHSTLVIQHYIGSTPYSTDWAAMLRRIMGEFKRQFGIEMDIPETTDALRSAFPNCLHIAAVKGRIILILDALNQLEDRDGAPDLVWLPPVMPGNVRIIVSTLPGRALDEIKKRGWPVMEVKALNVEERQELIHEFLRGYSRKLSPARVERIAAAPQSANPLYLRVLLDELRLFGKHGELEERISHYLEAGNPYELYGKVIARWEQDYAVGSNLAADTLSLLWAARRGLTESELLQALGTDDQPLPRAKWSPLYLAMSDALVSRGGLLTFAHEFLRTAVRDTYMPMEEQQRQAHLRLAGYFTRQPGSMRVLDELPWQLSQAEAWSWLFTLLSDLPFYDALWQASRFDAQTCWARLEENAFRMVDAYQPLLDSPFRFDINQVREISILLEEAGHPVESLSLCAHLEEHYRQTGDHTNLATSLCDQALILLNCGDLDGAMALLKQAEQICRELDYKHGLQKTLGFQALILKTRGELDGAMVLHKQQEQICHDLGNKDGMQASLNNQANILKDRGDLEGAMGMYKQQEQICRELGDKRSLSISLGNQARVLTDRGNLEGAMSMHKQAEQICRELGDKDGLQEVLGNQAAILHARGNLDGAMAMEKQVEQICRELGNKDGLSISLGNQALILKTRGNLDGAIAVYKQQEQICREIGNIEGLALSLTNQALVLANKGRLQDALPLVEQAFRMAQDHGLVAFAQQIEPFLNTLCSKLGIR